MTTKERPILFSGPMVRAILAGHKTQTRRVVTDRHFCRLGLERDGEFVYTSEGPQWNGEFEGEFWSPYGKPGDRLWVRETFAVCADSKVFWKADKGPEPWDGIKWKPSIHMPRRASRITLEVSEVRVERLQEITPKDAIAEGFMPTHENGLGTTENFRIAAELVGGPYPRGLFAMTWNQINGEGSWDENPWVWVVSFNKV